MLNELNNNLKKNNVNNNDKTDTNNKPVDDVVDCIRVVILIT